MIVYFGQDERGYFMDRADGSREYVSRSLWCQFIAAGAKAGADVSCLDHGDRVRLEVIESVTIVKFDGDQTSVPAEIIEFN